MLRTAWTASVGAKETSRDLRPRLPHDPLPRLPAWDALRVVLAPDRRNVRVYARSSAARPPARLEGGLIGRLFLRAPNRGTLPYCEALILGYPSRELGVTGRRDGCLREGEAGGTHTKTGTGRTVPVQTQLTAGNRPALFFRARRATSIAICISGMALAACSSTPPPSIVKTEIVPCPTRAPQPTCVPDLPVDVSDDSALDAYVRGSTPRAISQRLEGALRGWAGCAAEVGPWRAGHAACATPE